MENPRLVQETQARICKELNAAGFWADKELKLKFEPDLFSSMEEFVKGQLIFDPEIYSFLEKKKLIHFNFCILCGRPLNQGNTVRFTSFGRYFDQCTTCPSSAPIEQKHPKEGCYIATACYGSYDHPDVLILRKFRDEILNRFFIGKLTIRFYYRFSPMCANMLKRYSKLNNLVKITILAPIVRRLSK